MKQVTMESVKQRINELTYTGVVSLRGEFELACLRELVAVTEQRDALVVEIVALKSESEDACKWDGEQWVGISIRTPATSSAIAALRAEGVEMFASETEKLEWHESTTRFVRKFARQLRESKGAQS